MNYRQASEYWPLQPAQSLGIGIITDTQSDTLELCQDAILQHTTTPLHLIIATLGSPGTASEAKHLPLPII